MKYKDEIRTKNEVLVTSALKGPDKPQRVNSDGKIYDAKSHDRDPLIRTRSWTRKPPLVGDYTLMYEEDGAWKFFDLNVRFTSCTEAEKCLPGLHLVHRQVAVVQLWPNWQGYGPVRERDSFEIREHTGEDEN